MSREQTASLHGMLCHCTLLHVRWGQARFGIVYGMDTGINQKLSDMLAVLCCRCCKVMRTSVLWRTGCTSCMRTAVHQTKDSRNMMAVAISCFKLCQKRHNKLWTI